MPGSGFFRPFRDWFTEKICGRAVASPKGDLVSFPGTPVPGSGFFRPFRDWFTESKLLGTLPVVYNVANFSKPAEGKPALISFTKVVP